MTPARAQWLPIDGTKHHQHHTDDGRRRQRVPRRERLVRLGDQPQIRPVAVPGRRWPCRTGPARPAPAATTATSTASPRRCCHHRIPDGRRRDDRHRHRAADLGDDDGHGGQRRGAADRPSTATPAGRWTPARCSRSRRRPGRERSPARTASRAPLVSSSSRGAAATDGASGRRRRRRARAGPARRRHRAARRSRTRRARPRRPVGWSRLDGGRSRTRKTRVNSLGRQAPTGGARSAHHRTDSSVTKPRDGAAHLYGGTRSQSKKLLQEGLLALLRSCEACGPRRIQPLRPLAVVGDRAARRVVVLDRRRRRRRVRRAPGPGTAPRRRSGARVRRGRGRPRGTACTGRR